MKKNILLACMAILVADAACARFISADPLEGKKTDPRTLNRYSYAHSDPVHGRDPTGQFNMTEIGVGLTLGALTVGAAYYGVTSTLQAVAPETSPHRKMGVWDSVAIQYVESSASNTVSDEIEQERRRQPDTHGHHTIPVYLCGAVVQPQYADITPTQHAMIHTQIAGIALTIKAAEEYAYKTLGRIRMWEVLKIAQTDQGRGAIARALEGLYQAGWWTTGRAPNTIGNAFTASKPGFVSGAQTSLPWCTRNRGP